MKSRCGDKGYVIEVRLSELKDGRFSAEFLRRRARREWGDRNAILPV
jgi:hypothetical protein